MGKIIRPADDDAAKGMGKNNKKKKKETIIINENRDATPVVYVFRLSNDACASARRRAIARFDANGEGLLEGQTEL